MHVNVKRAGVRLCEVLCVAYQKKRHEMIVKCIAIGNFCWRSNGEKIVPINFSCNIFIDVFLLLFLKIIHILFRIQ